MLTLSVVELRLLLRKKITAISVVLVPLALVALTLLGGQAPDAELLATNFLLLLTLSVYLVSVTVFTARRQSLVLKRLRTSALPDWQILSGVLGPVVVVGLAQVVGYLAFCVAVDAPAPERPLLVAAAVGLGIVGATALGVATACLTRSVEATQVTSLPVVMAAMASLFLTSAPSPTLAAIGLTMPLAGPTHLLTAGWASAGTPVGSVPLVPLALLSSALWLALAGTAVRRWFRWDPRR